MQSFVDWEGFCRKWHIDFVKSNSSIARGYINVRCPLCRNADEGHHMGLHKRGWWTCYRDSVNHRGSNPRKVMMLLSGCSYAEADSFVQGEEVDISDFDQASLEFLSLDKDEKKREEYLEFPANFRALTSPRGRAKSYWQYLVSRGFSPGDVSRLSRRYDLHYCDEGEWRGRIIIPIYINGKLVSWTGRTFYDTEKLRYRSLTHDKSVHPHGLASIRDILFNFDRAVKKHHRVCVLVEGPLDALVVDYYGQKYGVTSVAAFGTGIRDLQLGLLERVKESCSSLMICGDKNADANVMDLLSATRYMNSVVINLPVGVEDPAELTHKQVRELFTKA